MECEKQFRSASTDRKPIICGDCECCSDVIYAPFPGRSEKRNWEGWFYLKTSATCAMTLLRLFIATEEKMKMVDDPADLDDVPMDGILRL